MAHRAGVPAPSSFAWIRSSGDTFPWPCGGSGGVGGRLPAGAFFGGSPGNDLDRSRDAVLRPDLLPQLGGATARALVFGDGADGGDQPIGREPLLRDGLGTRPQSADPPAPEELVAEVGREDGRRLAAAHSPCRGTRPPLADPSGPPRH